jgi:hypothetical protein
MLCVTCAAKKVVRDGVGKEGRLSLINEYSELYKLDIDAVKSEVLRLFNLRKS